MGTTLEQPRRGTRRFYNTSPNDMTLEQCAYHGGAHKVYNWNPQPDPRWSDEQYQAYITAYDGDTSESAQA
jgi:hypothetical protein